MNSHILLLVVLGAVLYSEANPTPPTATKCNPGIIDSIKELWGDNIPSDIITKSIANQKEVVIATTEGYYPTDTKCTYSFFKDSTLSITAVHTEGKPTTTDVVLQEKDGVLIDAGTNIKRYQVYVEGGVSAFYKCADNGATGKPEGMIKVRESDYDEEFIPLATEVLSKFEIKISKTYPVKCP